MPTELEIQKGKAAEAKKKAKMEADEAKKKAAEEAKKKKEEANKATTITQLTRLPDGATVKHLSIADLLPQEIAPREELKSLAKLTRSIKAAGVLEPLFVREHPDKKGKYEVVNGNRRLEVLKKLNVQTAPCIIMPMDAKQTMSHIFIANTQRQQLAKVDMVYIATNLIEAIGKDDAAASLGLTGKSLEALVKPKDTQRGGTAGNQPKETSVLLDAKQTAAFIAGDNLTATFTKAVANKGDTITIVGVLGKAKVSTVKDVKDGVKLTWTLAK